jgi:HEAT repeat protein
VARIEGERAVDVLVAALADPDYAMRIRALEAFETIRLEDTKPLEAALRDPNADVRRRAALALERVGYVDKVIARLASEDRGVAERAYGSLLELARVGLLDSVASYVHHERFEVRAIVARACGDLGMIRAAPLLLKTLDDPAWPVRAAVAEALGKLRPEGEAGALVKLLVDPEETVREAAAEGLTSYPTAVLEPHIEALGTAYDRGSVPIRQRMVTLVGRIGGQGAMELLVRASLDPSDGVRLRAVCALGERGGDVIVEPLLARLTDASLDVRMAAVAALGAAASTEAFEGLLRALAGAQPAVRDRIAEALARGGKEHLFQHMDELEQNGALDVRLGIAWTLGKTQDPAGVPTLARFLRDQNEKLRASAAGALAKIDDKASLEALLTAAEDPDAHVRAAVTNALGRLGEGEPRVYDVLEKRARDPDRFVRNRSLVSLARTGRASVEARVLRLGSSVDLPAALVAYALVASDESLSRVLDALASPGTLEAIIAFLEREDPPVRTAFFAAMRLEDPAANAIRSAGAALVSQYEQVLRTSLDVSARRLAIKALARLKGDRTVEVLADALVADPAEAVRLEAALALAPRADEEAARKGLARAVADPAPEVTICAVKALAKRKEPEAEAALARRLGTGSAHVQEAVEEVLAEMHRDDPFPFLDWMMGVDIPELLVPAVRVLERMMNPTTIPLLRELLKSRAATVRTAAVRALGNLAIPEATAAVDDVVEDPSEDVRLAVLDCITASPEALLRTAPLRRDPSVRVRARLATALERFDGPARKAAQKLVEGLLGDASPLVRASALATIIGPADSDGLKAFAKAWGEASPETRLELKTEPRAAEFSRRLATKLLTFTAAADRKNTLIALGSFAVPGFHVHALPALRDPAPDVRIAAVQALAPIQDADVRARLAELLGDPDGSVRDIVRRAMIRTVG